MLTAPLLEVQLWTKRLGFDALGPPLEYYHL